MVWPISFLFSGTEVHHNLFPVGISLSCKTKSELLVQLRRGPISFHDTQIDFLQRYSSRRRWIRPAKAAFPYPLPWCSPAINRRSSHTRPKGKLSNGNFPYIANPTGRSPSKIRTGRQPFHCSASAKHCSTGSTSPSCPGAPWSLNACALFFLSQVQTSVSSFPPRKGGPSIRMAEGPPFGSRLSTRPWYSFPAG